MNKQKEYNLIHNIGDAKVLSLLYKLGFIGIFVVCLIILFDKSVSSNINIWLIVFALVLVWLKFGSYLNKSAYKITINPEEDEIEFFMMKTEKTVVKKISNIEKVNINLYITFHFESQEVVFNSARNLKLLNELEEYFNLEYGIWGKLLPKLGFKN